ncbi:hypothetical protein BGX23_003051 [Mortierella sp. AD031]|nr:hypothetical protein BGX23_003051 [Mortierella sp. AD031]
MDKKPDEELEVQPPEHVKMRKGDLEPLPFYYDDETKTAHKYLSVISVGAAGTVLKARGLGPQ